MAKLGLMGFDMLLATHMQNVPLYENVLNRMNIEVGDDKKIPDNVFDNLKMMFKVVIKITIEKTPLSISTNKMITTLRNMQPYGTEKYSTEIEEFLIELSQSKASLIITPSEGELFKLLTTDDTGELIYNPELIENLNLLMGHNIVLSKN